MTFSRRLDWDVAENALARAAAARRAAGAALFDLAESNPTRAGLAAADDEIAAAFAQPGLGAYAPEALGLPGAREAVAAELARLGAAVNPEHLALVASSSEAYGALGKLLCDPGDAVLVPEPSYPLFDFLFALEGVHALPYRLGFHAGFHFDGAAAAQAADAAAKAGRRPRALVVVSPHNPTGATLDAHEAVAADQLCAERGMALVVDEVFADFAPSPRSVLAAPHRALTFALGGLSKSCGLPQMKLGFVGVAGPDGVRAEALARLGLVLDTYLQVGTPVQLALPRLLALGAGVRERIRERLARNRARLVEALRGKPVTAISEPAGWSVVLRVPATRSDEAWALALLAEGVLVQPGYFFDLPPDFGAGTCLVVSLLPEPAVFDAGLGRLLEVTGAP